MKKISLGLIVMLLIFPMVAVGYAQEAKITQVGDLAGKVIGAPTAVVPNDIQKQIFFEQTGVELKEILNFGNTSDAAAGLLAGKVDACLFSQITVDYYTARNSKLASLPALDTNHLDIIMAMRAEDEELRAYLNVAIDTLTKNGTLAKLQSEWIDNLPVGNEPVGGEVPKIAGAKTIHVGVSGDIIPLDYIAVDGKPAGYSIEILSEISKLINVNFEFVHIATEAKFTALSSGRIDMIFAHFQNSDFAALEAMKNNSWISTDPYYTIGLGMLVMK